jgi:hypothetical protein
MHEHDPSARSTETEGIPATSREDAWRAARAYFLSTLQIDEGYVFIDEEHGAFDPTHQEWSFPVIARPYHDARCDVSVDTVSVGADGNVRITQPKEAIVQRVMQHARTHHQVLIASALAQQRLRSA